MGNWASTENGDVMRIWKKKNNPVAIEQIDYLHILIYAPLSPM